MSPIAFPSFAPGHIDLFRAMALRPNPDVMAKRLDDVTVLVHISTNRIFELNETGTRVWEMLGQGLDSDRIVRHLIDDFAVEDTQAADEVKDLLARLQSEGLLCS
jgi:Coenzyme PQQ synthesis protein D (PqqD)